MRLDDQNCPCVRIMHNTEKKENNKNKKNPSHTNSWTTSALVRIRDSCEYLKATITVNYPQRMISLSH